MKIQITLISFLLASFITSQPVVNPKETAFNSYNTASKFGLAFLGFYSTSKQFSRIQKKLFKWKDEELALLEQKYYDKKIIKRFDKDITDTFNLCRNIFLKPARVGTILSGFGFCIYEGHGIYNAYHNKIFKKK